LDVILLAYLILNLIAFIGFGLDKGKAVRGRQRIEERRLLLAALLGPFGAYAGMRLLHHKTRRLKFKLVLIFLLLHSILIVYLLVYGARPP
jgi:uncharacterized membrane protein YsdA (DUF1294 family)